MLWKLYVLLICIIKIRLYIHTHTHTHKHMHALTHTHLDGGAHDVMVIVLGNRLHEFKSWMRLFAFHIAIINFRKA